MPHPTASLLRTGATALVTVAIFAGCTTAASVAPPTAAPSAMAEHSAMPSATAMMEHSAAPSGSAMAEHSAMPSVAAPVSTGTFHGVDGTATGTVALFHNADGTFTVTFEGFSTPTATSIHAALVPNKDVTKDADIDKSTLIDLGPLTGNTGMQDFKVPGSADAMTFHTVLLWDTAMTHAVAAAPLQ